jgi:intergrase/recombinase
MKALASLSKFQGMYGAFQKLIKDYGLKWSSNHSAELMIARLTKVTDCDDIFAWIRQVKAHRPKLSDFMDFMTISGLRFNEAIESYNLIIRLWQEGRLKDYYNEESEILEHYKFKEIFIRASKKAFISFMPHALILKISRNAPLKEGGVASLVKRSGLKMRFGDIREAHGTLLTKYLRQPEIDFLHGRVGISIFMTNYFNPALIKDLKERTMNAIQNIISNIQSIS